MQIEIDAKKLKVKELRALEKARTFDEMAQWLGRNCGVTEAEIDDMTLAELMELSGNLQASIKGALSLPKVSGGN